MALETRLEARLTQKLVLTPQLQLAIKLLQLPQLELTQAINQEMIENPFLEEQQEEVIQGEEQVVEPATTNDSVESEITTDTLTTFSVDDYFEERSSDGRDLGYFNSGMVEKPGFETFLTTTSDLTDHLKWQLRFCNASDDLRELAEMVIGNIDENGYLCATVKELVALLNVSAAKVQKAIALVQSFDPRGVGARDLQECLQIQLRFLGLEGTIAESMVCNNLGDLEKKKYHAIARQYMVGVEEVIAAVRVIEQLEPKPGRNYSNSQIAYVVPDVFIDKVGDSYRIILNDEHIPRIRISSMYRELLQNKKALDKEDRQFMLDKYKSALWLMKSLDERNKTIYRVTESVLKFQTDFFERGVQSLKPLNLKVIAEDISMHESNISRVTSNKYLSCGHGVFPFRYFFSSSLSSQDGDVSSTSVKELIKKIIAEEDRRNPLPDIKIVEMFKSQNIKIARRTLAKYREELRIPSHTKRKVMD
ncbi:MAG: RNA polymerase factor sigma-54 [Magnetococcales bacterium]|uniref:RNA polymerase factor sigma-54 n=1 Tax=Candidatus Magnetobacterium casense TaxID=1455061 RepID=A0ABS6RXE2_9BACT|nr:RNA polymerase factor sigma-54 [Candidatus Magnetobacterium casensis]MBF0606022.1 RNA polymerase factor sigma-54 [Nitrospirota bacterium]MBV6340928.1 RNA polymerase factor sigma-54 [Candidatus Magnetobacterium casensis]